MVRNIDVETLRDSAISLREKKPYLAFKLIAMAKKYHPKGPLINQIFNELKKDLNIRTAVVIGNCQAIPISSMIESKTKKYTSMTQLLPMLIYTMIYCIKSSTIQI